MSFPAEVNYEERRAVIGLLTINRHDVLFWLLPKWAVKKGERPTSKVRRGGVHGVVRSMREDTLNVWNK